MHVDYNAVATAVKVAELNSFTRASELLQTPTSTVSARVQALEATLGTKLFQRSTRRVRLTEAGQLFFEHARRGNEAFEDAVTIAARLADQPHGLLRVVVPSLFARHLLPRILPRFLSKYPDLKLTFATLNVLPDLVDYGADVGIGVGMSRRAAYTRRSLTSFSQALYASPMFVSRRGTPGNPDELARQPLLAVGDRQAVSWMLVSGARRHAIKCQARVSVSDVSSIHALTLAGLGIALLPEQLCEHDVATGALIKLLPNWSSDRVQVSAYYQRRRLEPRKVKVFLDHLIEWFGKPSAA
jgi:DNA-binding transcriptional LysR family regulator